MKHKIYIVCDPAPNWGPYDVLGFALAEDGTGLASHLSSNTTFAKHDMGITSDWKHDIYKNHYPEGFELEWVDDPDTHEGFKLALEKNHKLEEPVEEENMAKVEVTFKE